MRISAAERELTSSVILHRNEMVSVDSSKPHEAPGPAEDWMREVKEFWERNTFLYEPPEDSEAERYFRGTFPTGGRQRL